jgi:uncharacterized lipoprotein YddW (UPF0748 family)
MRMTKEMIVLFALSGCSPDPTTIGAPDFGDLDARRCIGAHCPDLAEVDLSSDDASPGLDGGFDASDDAATLENVSHTRELRAAWVGTVFRLDFPSRTDLTAAEARAEISSIVDATAAAGLNAIMFQVRPESDTFYDSTLEPWSRFVSGTQGVAPAYDPLALFLELGHKQGLEIHAWMNPYRALATPGTPTHTLHVTKRFPAAAITYNGAVTMNPADTTVRAFVVSVATDITSRYDIDGVVFDDYFYPYPGATPFPDDASYTAYTNGGGTLNKSDWRRDNVNALVSAVNTAIHTAKPWVRFGIAPFGIYRPNMPPGVTGLDSYEAISCDSLKWIDSGWVDYLAPQLYWSSTSSGQPFGALIDWWASHAKPGRPVLSSLALYKLGTSSEWTTSEIETQVALTRGESGAAGQTWFRFDYLRDDTLGILASFDTFYASPARPPTVLAAASQVVSAPQVAIGPASVALNHAMPSGIGGYAVYRWNGTKLEYSRWVPVGTAPIALAAGRYSISAIGRGGVESQGVSVVIP